MPRAPVSVRFAAPRTMTGDPELGQLEVASWPIAIMCNEVVPGDQVVKVTITFGGRSPRQPARKFDAGEDEIRDWIRISREKAVDAPAVAGATRVRMSELVQAPGRRHLAQPRTASRASTSAGILQPLISTEPETSTSRTQMRAG
jgi:hypothetical protein